MIGRGGVGAAYPLRPLCSVGAATGGAGSGGYYVQGPGDFNQGGRRSCSGPGDFNEGGRRWGLEAIGIRAGGE